MSWAGRRKGLYIGTISLIAGLIVAGGAYLILSRPATCSDGIQNGTETGVDCGGSCLRLCKEDARMPNILWQRVFMVAPGVYTVAAYIENRNRNGYVQEAPYQFQLRDSNNNVIAERQGTTAIPPGRISAVVETNIATGNSIPVRTLFEFSNNALVWKTGESPNIQVQPDPLDVDARRQTVVVTNLSGREISHLPVTVVLFDANDTAIAASESIIARLPRDGSERVVFTWPSAFSSTPVRAEVQAIAIPQ